MYYDDQFGVVAPEIGWVPAPRYILRRRAVLSLFRRVEPGRVLEIGCGSGALLVDLSRLGFAGLGVDTSSAAREVASYLLQSTDKFDVSSRVECTDGEAFDFVIALEVLEHIADDEKALEEWAERLKHDGTLILSVPANPARWSADDTWAGHYRRYTRSSLAKKLENCGYQATQIESYGWPLSVVIDFMRSRIREQQIAAHEGRPYEEATAKSGIDRELEVKYYRTYANPIGKTVFRVGFALQQWAKATDWGTGYIAVARLAR